MALGRSKWKPKRRPRNTLHRAESSRFTTILPKVSPQNMTNLLVYSELGTCGLVYAMQPKGSEGFHIPLLAVALSRNESENENAKRNSVSLDDSGGFLHSGGVCFQWQGRSAKGHHSLGGETGERSQGQDFHWHDCQKGRSVHSHRRKQIVLSAR